MAKFLVQKSGPLTGEVTISGSKNAVLPIMAAALLTEEKCTIMETPALRDVDVMCQLLESLGAEVEDKLEDNIVEIEAKTISQNEAPFELVKKMRASILVIGPLLARIGKAVIPLPGGCAIGKRPIELHLKGLRALGVEIKEESGTQGPLEAKVDRLVGNDIYLDFPSVGATEVIMMTAAVAEGTTVIENAAQEPEIVDLANFLNKMGAKIKGAGTAISTDIKTLPYPGFPTDMQSPFMALLTVAKGPSVVIETVFENRFMHVAEFNRMGANIKTQGNCAIIPGDKQLQGAQVVATDLRAGAAVVLTGLVAEGTTEVSDIYHIDRGYENFVEKFRGLGATILRIED